MRKKTKKISKPARESAAISCGRVFGEIRNGYHSQNWWPWRCSKNNVGTIGGDLYSLTPSGWMRSTAEDITKIDYEKLLKKYHAFLKPIWDQFRDALFDYKYGIIPDREQLHRSRKNIDRDKASAVFEYQSPLKEDTVLDWRNFTTFTEKII